MPRLGWKVRDRERLAPDLLQRDRQALVEQFGRERHAQLEEATRGVSEALEGLGDDLRFAGELLAQPGSTEEHRRELRALLEAVGQYRAIAVYGPDGAEQLSLVDRRAQLMPREAAHAAALAETARQALAAPHGRIIPSPPGADSSSGWMRVFATPLPADAPGGGGAVAILVDTEPFFAPLRLVTAGWRTSCCGPRSSPRWACSPRGWHTSPTQAKQP